MNLSLPIRIILAAVSGIGVPLIPLTGNWIDHGIWDTISSYVLQGLVFAVGVLFPYVSRSKFKLCRALGLIAASAASYWCAVMIAVETRSFFGMLSASVVGALIVMGALLLLAPIRSSVMYVVLGFLAGISGGLIMYYTLDATEILSFAGYAAWHVLVCLAIYFGTPTTRGGECFSAYWGRRIGSG